mmetsp:Transcript_5471/g.8433  ORF Transcript_5471/g.8433 Transcript_5471/m.8433 type:complete len:131 (-) Transcript_5471:126-518(-)
MCSLAKADTTETQRTLHLVDTHQERYELANKFEKTDLADKIISLVHESNGRFLKQDESNNGCWVQLDDADARKKVPHWFRHTSSKSKQQSKKEPEANQTKSASNAGTRTVRSIGSDEDPKKVKREYPTKV